MIDSSKLWTKLPPKADNIEGIRQDLKAGLVPNLPYFIIDNKEAKEKISKDILNIDTQFSLAYIIANYGNGKTNLLRYLVYHQYSVPTILQVVTPISFLKKVILVSFLG